MNKKILYIILLLLCPKLESGPLHLAVQNGDLGLVQKLVQKDPSSINDLREDKLSALHCCVLYDQYEIAEFLLQQTEHIDIDVIGQQISTPLHIAASRNKVAFVTLLLNNKANANLGNILGNTPLMLAIDSGSKEAAQALLPKSDLSIKNKAAITAFMKAAEKGNLEILKQLYQRGSLPDEMDKNELTPLIVASHNGHVAIVKFLLDTKKVDINRLTKSGFCPLRAAVVGKHFDVLDLLLEKGADPEVQNSFGDTLLHTAADRGDMETIEIVSKYANLDAQNNMGNTPAHIGAHNANLSVMRFLIAHGARTDIQNHNNNDFWHSLPSKNKRIYVTACKKAEKECKKQEKRQPVQLPANNLPFGPATAATPPKKKRKRKSRKAKSVGKAATATKNVITESFKQKKETATQYFRAARNMLSLAPGRFDPVLLRRWSQVSTLVGPAKRKKITSREPSPAIIEYSGTFSEDSPYQVRLFNCFKSNPGLAEDSQFIYNIDYSTLYSPEISERLSLVSNLKRDGLDHLLVKDHNTSIPTLTCAPYVHNDTYKDLLLHPKVGKKLDLYHLIDFNPSLIKNIGITFIKKKDDGFTTVEVRIPGEITFTHNNSEQTEAIVLELSFKQENYGEIGPCIHRFARPVHQVKESIVLDELETFRQQYLTN